MFHTQVGGRGTVNKKEQLRLLLTSCFLCICRLTGAGRSSAPGAAWSQATTPSIIACTAVLLNPSAINLLTAEFSSELQKEPEMRCLPGWLD